MLLTCLLSAGGGGASTTESTWKQKRSWNCLLELTGGLPVLGSFLWHRSTWPALLGPWQLLKSPLSGSWALEDNSPWSSFPSPTRKSQLLAPQQPSTSFSLCLSPSSPVIFAKWTPHHTSLSCFKSPSGFPWFGIKPTSLNGWPHFMWLSSASPSYPPSTIFFPAVLKIQPSWPSLTPRGHICPLPLVQVHLGCFASFPIPPPWLPPVALCDQT